MYVYTYTHIYKFTTIIMKILMKIFVDIGQFIP